MGHRQESLTFELRPVPPFRLDLTVWALRRRRRNLVDRWDGTTYRRVVVVGGRPTELAVRQAGSSAAPRLSVTAPYAGLVYLHLLLDGLSQAGTLDSTPGPSDGQCVAIG